MWFLVILRTLGLGVSGVLPKRSSFHDVGLEADEYAFMSAVEHLKKGGKDPSAFLLSPGFLLQCMYLIQFLTRFQHSAEPPRLHWSVRRRILAIAHHEGLRMSYRYEQIAPLERRGDHAIRRIPRYLGTAGTLGRNVDRGGVE